MAAAGAVRKTSAEFSGAAQYRLPQGGDRRDVLFHFLARNRCLGCRRQAAGMLQAPVFAVGVAEEDVGTGAAFEFADSGGCGAEVLGDLGEGESSLVAQGSEVVGAGCRGWVDEEVPGLAGDRSFQAAQDVFLAFAGGPEFGGVGFRACVGGQADERDLVQGSGLDALYTTANGIIIGKPQDETYYEEYKKIYKKLFKSYDLSIAYNFNFGHT